jgi:phosphoglycolate phosphatase-like HAD superfamily hydrolase
MRAVIFDMDGTLIDSVDLHAKAWQEAFQKFGHRFSFDRIRSQIGKGGDQLLPFFLPPDEVEAKGKDIEKYRGDLFKKEYLSKVKPFPKVRSLFQRFLHDGWKIALASSAKGDELPTYKDMTHITDLLQTETSSDDAEKSKPHPDIFLAALERLGDIQPHECLIVGDSPYDAEAASKASIPAIGFLCGGFQLDELQRAGYKAIYQDPADLLANFEQFTRTLAQEQLT